ncbi:MAG: AAA family ATPase, partial [Gammaproteobacteria bacterium]
DNRLVAMRALQDYLLERHAENRQVVIFVEEAQSMPLATLEEIRLLSNLETGQNKLLQMVMFGQPELDEQLARPQIRQLRERITHNFKLGPLSRNEIRDYLNARLRSCGYRGGNLFSNAAIALITRYSQGLLRRINILADKALLSAYAGNKRRVGRRQVMAAVRDSEMRPAWTAWLWPAIALIALAVVAVAARPYLPGLELATFIKPVVESPQPAVIEPTSGPEATGSGLVETPVSQPRQEPEAAVISEPALTASDDVDAVLTLENTDDIDELETGSFTETQAVETEILNDSEVNISDASLIKIDAHGLTIPAATEPVNILAATSYMNTSSRDIERLRTQIEQFPPEDIWLDEPDPAATCRLCTTIIYRPLKNNENL